MPYYRSWSYQLMSSLPITIYLPNCRQHEVAITFSNAIIIMHIVLLLRLSLTALYQDSPRSDEDKISAYNCERRRPFANWT